MDPKEQSPLDQPVAYDANGQPLYSHPYSSPEPINNETQLKDIQMTKPTVPEKPIISDVTRLKHERSSQIFPYLNLSDDEYIIIAVRRHPIGLFIPFIIGFFLVLVSTIVIANYELIAESLQFDENIGLFSIALPATLFIGIVVLGVYLFYSVYINNKFFLTNESVIQEIQTGIFSKQEQTVSLMNIEDVSFTQNGIIQQIFNYGSIRLSTEGDKTIYNFNYVANPKQHIATLTNAIEAYKNGRPVD